MYKEKPLIMNYPKGIENKIKRGETKEIRTEMKKYDEHLKANHIKERTRYSVISQLSQMLNHIGKHIKKIELEDIEEYIVSRNLEGSTKKLYISMIRRYFQYAYNMFDMEYPDCVKGLPTKFYDTKNRQGQKEIEPLIEEDIFNMIETTDNKRDKAIVITLFESGYRKAEFLSLDIEDIEIQDDCAYINKNGLRPLKLVWSKPYIVNWLKIHPLKHNKEIDKKPLWVSQRENRLSTNGLDSIVKALGKHARIKNKIYPHLFRHSCATYLAKHLKDAELRIYMGWAPGSKQTGRYTHLRPADVHDKVIEAKTTLKIKALKEKPPSPLEAIKCDKCNELNPPNYPYCNCGNPLRPDLKEKELEVKKIKSDVKVLQNVIDALLEDYFKEQDNSDHKIADLKKKLNSDRPIKMKDILPES